MFLDVMLITLIIPSSFGDILETYTVKTQYWIAMIFRLSGSTALKQT